MATNASTIDRDTLKHRVEDIPNEVLPHIRMGFHLLSTIDADKRIEFIRSVITKMLNRESINTRDTATRLGINANIIGDVLAAVGLPIGATIDLSVSPDEFIEAARGKLFDDEDTHVAREVVEAAFSQKDNLKSVMDTSSLADAVFPSFRQLRVEIDLRLRFSEDGIIETTVPVAVMYLETDILDPLSFQASRDDLSRIIDRLQKVAANMDRAATVTLGEAP